MRNRLRFPFLLAVTVASTLVDGRECFASSKERPYGVLPKQVRSFHACISWDRERSSCATADSVIRLAQNALAKRGVNLLVLEVDYNFDFTSVPKIGNPNGLNRADTRRVVQACRALGIKVVPEFECLGHQTDGPGTLLGEYPETREVAGEFADKFKDAKPDQSAGLSYCPRAPGVHDKVFALLDELADDFQADIIHVGMDEIVDLASSKCPRCAGADPADIIASEVNAIHDHLAARHVAMMMWGDRFLDGSVYDPRSSGYASSFNYTYPAIDHVPKDIVVCDWHYDNTPASAAYFAQKGFRVIAAWWNDWHVALNQLRMTDTLDHEYPGRAIGGMQSTWCDIDAMARAEAGPQELSDAPDRQAKRWQDDAVRTSTAADDTFHRVATCWLLTGTQLDDSIRHQEDEQANLDAKRLVLWDGDWHDTATLGASNKSPADYFREESDDVFDGKVSAALHLEGTGWVGGTLNWRKWWPPDAGDDLSKYQQLTMAIKVSGTVPGSLNLAVITSSNKTYSAIIDLRKYVTVDDPKWSSIAIPISALIPAPDPAKPAFDVRKAWGVEISTWSNAPANFTVYLDDLALENSSVD